MNTGLVANILGIYTVPGVLLCYRKVLPCYRRCVTGNRWVLVIYTVLECALGVACCVLTFAHTAVLARAFAYIDASLDLNTERSFDKWI